MVRTASTTSPQGVVKLMKIPNDLQIVPTASIPKGQHCPVDDLPELYKLGLSMQIICEKEKGIGLAAVQIGLPLNFFVVNFKDGFRFFLNCTYTPVAKEKEKYVEGCLSIKTPEGKSRYFEVERFKNVIIKGKELVAAPTLQIKDFEMTPTDYYKIVFQHEIDHAFEILISQIGKEVFLWSK